MSPDSQQSAEYFFNARTKMVEKGRQSSWDDLMGPYNTREEAQMALEKAQQRNDTWDDADDSWRGNDG